MTSSLYVSFVRLLTLLALGVALLSACTAPSQQDEPAANSAGGDAALDSEDALDDVALDDPQPDASPDVPPEQDSADANETDTDVSCTPVEDYINGLNAEIIDCGHIQEFSSTCSAEENSCFLNALQICSPAKLVLTTDGGIDGKPWTWTFVVDGSRQSGKCTLTQFLDRRSDDTVRHEAATLTSSRVLESDVTPLDEGCSFTTHNAFDAHDWGSCADVFASCPICQW